MICTKTNLAIKINTNNRYSTHQQSSTESKLRCHDNRLGSNPGVHEVARRVGLAEEQHRKQILLQSQPETQVTLVEYLKWIVPQFFKLLPKPHIFFDLVIRFITNRKYAFFCISWVKLSADNTILIYWIKINYVQL